MGLIILGLILSAMAFMAGIFLLIVFTEPHK